MKRIYTRALLATLLTACSTTKFIADDEQLYTGIKDIEFIESNKYATTSTGETAMEEVTCALDYAPNGAIF